MKKLLLSLLALLSCLVLATPVYADVAAPGAFLFDYDSGMIFVTLGVMVVIVGVILFLLLRKRK